MEKFDTMERRLLVYAALIFTLIAYTLKPRWFDFTNIMTALSAIGTVGAIAVALHLARSGQRAQRRIEYDRATLAAAQVVADLEGPIEALSAARASFIFGGVTDELSIEDQRRRINTQTKEEIIRCVNLTEWAQDVELMRDLIPLPNHAAHRLHYGCRKVYGLRLQVMRVNERWSEMSAIDQQRWLEKWTGALWAAGDFLVVALHECKQAAELGAPAPTSLEVYGEDVGVWG